MLILFYIKVLHSELTFGRLFNIPLATALGFTSRSVNHMVDSNLVLGELKE